MFFSLVLSIVGLFNSASENRKAIVEDYPFRLCYYVTAALLFFFTSLLGVKDAFRKYIFKRKLQSTYRECVRAGAAGSQTLRFLGHHLLHPLILRFLVLCAPAVLRPRALQDAPAPADPKS